MDVNKVSDRELREEYVKRFMLKDGNKIGSAEMAADHFRGLLEFNDREQFMVIYLNGRNRHIGSEILFTGSISTSSVYPREVIKEVLNKKAVAVVFGHNHPSGNNNPSKDDLVITNKLKTALEAIDVIVQDHVIIANGGYYSFADHGLI